MQNAIKVWSLVAVVGAILVGCGSDAAPQGPSEPVDKSVYTSIEAAKNHVGGDVKVVCDDNGSMCCAGSYCCRWPPGGGSPQCG